jgi:hypothetical protein
VLVEITSPPAPDGWNQPGYELGARWEPAEWVWWTEWRVFFAPWPGMPLPDPSNVLGRVGIFGVPEGIDGHTHLLRHTFDIQPPQEGMRVASARLRAWTDNNSFYWWQGRKLPFTGEGFLGEFELSPDYVRPEGGQYLLAVQTSNKWHNAGDNPHGTSFEVVVDWECYNGSRTIRLPLIMRRY